MTRFARLLAVAAGALLAFPTLAQSPRYGGELVFPVPSEPPSYDGHREETFGLIHPLAPFYNTLLRVDPTDKSGTKPYPSLAESKAVERSIPCRPCSRNGRRPCPRGTQECLTGIPVDSVQEALWDLLEKRGPARYVHE